MPVTDTGETCQMPDCSSKEELRECRDPDDDPVRACSDCRSDWPRQLRVVES